MFCSDSGDRPNASGSLPDRPGSPAKDSSSGMQVFAYHKSLFIKCLEGSWLPSRRFRVRRYLPFSALTIDSHLASLLFYAGLERRRSTCAEGGK
jgi:hypothetical protein